ncbi:MAG TPA: hypothetical protein VG842_06575 [Sediminibacterium sp.]|nr:hypothetical protein [Sediminibacterium sp.]
MNFEQIIEEHAHHFLHGIKTEYQGDKSAILVIRKYLSGDPIREEEYTLLKTQLFDSLKLLGIGIPFVLIPGASILMPLLIRVADKHHIELMPAAFNDPIPPSPPEEK